MGHYAKVLEGKVVQVIVAEADFFDSFVDTEPGDWVQTSYNTHGGAHLYYKMFEPSHRVQTSYNTHGGAHLLGGTPLLYNFAGVGWNYDKEADAFYAPQPFPSWTLNTENYLWKAPVSYPDDGQDYVWDEAAYQADNTQGWTLVE